LDVETFLISFICEAPAKRTQHVNAKYRNIAGCKMLRASGHRVATCCDMLGVVGSNLSIFKLRCTHLSEIYGSISPNLPRDSRRLLFSILCLIYIESKSTQAPVYLTITPVARKGYGSMVHEAKCFSIIQLVEEKRQ